ncbi:MAG: hypothetical protein H0V29_01155 [Thermoleophilaceae bacterium]|nr:hypothetical protein [Thermoleophilaceae bacterium]
MLPITALILSAAVLAGRRGERARRPFSIPARATVVGLALIAFVAVLIPLSWTSSVRASQRAARGANITSALGDATAARRVAPFAATPSLQEALVRESAGDLPGAAASARRATKAEPDNWRTWLVLSRLEAKQERAAASVAAYRRARSLSPRSRLFQR